MSVSAAPRGTTRFRSIQDFLDRPLASYHLVLGATVILLVIGLGMVLSASSIYSLNLYGNPYGMFVRQSLFAVVGVVGFGLALKVPLPVIRKFTLPLLAAVLVLIALTFTPLGLEINGNRNWLPLFGGFRLQPSEFAKVALVLWIAHIYTARHKQLGTTRYLFLPMVPVAGLLAGLVVLQKDLGTAVILIAVIAGMLFVAGLAWRHMAAVLIGLVVLLVFAIATAPHRMTRFLTFMDPMSDPEKSGYQAIKAMMGFARGGFWGLGLGNSRQKWGALPEAHTDFILAVIGEELGLAGGLVILALFVTLGVTGLRIARQSTDQYARYLAAGITIWLMAQAAINIAMVLGLMPVVGVPLPLISYGGSSLIATLAALGLLANCATTEPGAARALARGRRERARGRKA